MNEVPPLPGPTGAPTMEPLLDVHDIQGNILAGFNKDYQTLLALKIRDVASARKWLSRILPDINSTAEVHQFNELFRLRRKRLKRDPDGLIATWANIAFTHSGLSLLASPEEADSIPDEAFKIGLNKDRAGGFNDPLAPGETDPTKGWAVGGTDHPLDILLIVASDSPRRLAAAVRKLRPKSEDGRRAPKVVWKESGATRPDLPGHEHFGFKDGVSQPGIRGLVSQQPPAFLTRRVLEPAPAGEVEFSKPGQPLVWPGQFVFGYPETNGSSDGGGSAQEPNPALPALAKNGSLLVFRRLYQDVARFFAFLREQAAEVAKNPAFAEVAPERLGALLVGRWPSGAPIERAPLTDNPDLGNDTLANNDFLFANDTPAPAFLPGSPVPRKTFPPARDDTNGNVCPHAGHIRKMNPRDQDSDKGDQFDTLTRRILRRGIPYGAPFKSDAAGDDGVDRGLHFLCYQTSIVKQFETLQQDWANNINAPKPLGHDLIIGQVDPTIPGTPRICELITPGGVSVNVTASQQFVIPKGGAYCFAPSLTVLHQLAQPRPAGPAA